MSLSAWGSSDTSARPASPPPLARIFGKLLRKYAYDYVCMYIAYHCCSEVWRALGYLARSLAATGASRHDFSRPVICIRTNTSFFPASADYTTHWVSILLGRLVKCGMLFFSFDRGPLGWGGLLIVVG